MKKEVDILRNKIDDNLHEGGITGITEYGVFVRIDGRFGLIHKKELKQNLSDLKKGQKISFYIRDFLKNDNFLLLSQFDDKSIWATVEYGDVLDGEVYKKTHYGYFIKLDERSVGVIHTKTYDVTLEVGQKIKVKVLAVKKGKKGKRIWLKPLKE